MSTQVKNAIKSYYFFKNLAGKKIPEKVFGFKFNIPRWLPYDYLIHDKSFIIRDIKLITFDYIKTVEPLLGEPLLEDSYRWRCWYSKKLRGTCLFVLSDILIPWYLLPENNNENLPIFDDILPDHINKKLKDYDGVIKYLKICKKLLIQNFIQQSLPGF